MAWVGIDFGTTNSSVMFRDRDNTMRGLLHNGPREAFSAPTELYILRNGTVRCGWEIGDTYRRSSPPELIRNLKERLLDDTDDQKISGRDKWELFQLYMQYLINDANTSTYLVSANDRVEEVVLSYPYAASTLYVTKLKECTEAVEAKDNKGNSYHVKVRTLQEEPVSISLSYYEKHHQHHKGSVLICDIGGGTTDFAIVSDVNGRKTVLAHDGMRQAGNYIDQLILEFVVRHVDFSAEDYFSPQNEALAEGTFEVRTIKELIESDQMANIRLINHSTQNGIQQEKYDFTVQEYHLIIAPFVEQIIRKSEELIKRHPVSALVLAGGVANCKFLQQRFRDVFPEIPVFTDESDCVIATAAGNAAVFYIPVIRLLNHSYGVRCYDKRKEVPYIGNIFFKDEKLPIRDRCRIYVTNYSCKEALFCFYQGTVTDCSDTEEYNLNNQKQLANKTFVYKFETEVPEGTIARAYFSMDESGIMTMQVKSDYGSDQSTTLTGMS